MAEEVKGSDEVESDMKIDSKADSGNAAQGPRFEIKKWNAVTMWSWDICADTCAICRNSLNEPSIEYQVEIFETCLDLLTLILSRRIHLRTTKMV